MPHSLSLGFLALELCCSTLVIAADEPTFDYPPEIALDTVRGWIDRAPKGHPRLFASKADLAGLREQADADPTAKALADAIIQEAEALLELEPIERKLQGRRLLGESRRCVKRTLVLSTAFHLTGDDRFAKRCEAEMVAVAAFKDWNPSHFLDVGEMTFALAVGYDWLFDQLSDKGRTEIRRAILELGVELPFTTKHKGWVTASNNWGQVCHGGLTAGALAIMEDEPDWAAKTVLNALQNLPRSMHAFAPHGGYPEGPGYWAYGTSYNVVLLAILESALGTDFGLTQAPGFSVTGQYPALMTGPSGQAFNYADGGAGRSPQSCLFWFAQRFRRPDWLLGERERIVGAAGQVSAKSAASGGDRLLPLALLWMDDQPAEAAVKMPPHWSSGSATPITVHRGSWTDPDTTFVGLKGGSPAGPHGQMDTGSFVLDALGVRWAVDLGAEGYNGIESRGMNLWSSAQDSDRWTIFRQMNAGHNTLLIDDQLQFAKGKAPIVAFSDDPNAPYSIVDLAPVYADQVETAKRGIALLDGRDVLIQDELSGLKPGSKVRWGMITPGTVATNDGPLVVLAQGDQRLTMSILSPEDAGWVEIDTATPRHEWDSANRGTRMLAFETIAPASGELTLRVFIQPGDQPQRPAPAARKLGEWSG